MPSVLRYISIVVFVSVAYSCVTSVERQSRLPDTYNPTIQLSVRTESDAEEIKKIEIPFSILQSHLKEKSFTVEKHPAYGNRKVHYFGFDFKDLIQFAKNELKVQSDRKYQYSIWASDNFSAFVSDSDLNSGHAFLAFQELDPDDKSKSQDGLWSNVEKHGNPGPFYLVWDNPEKTYWQKWPFKIAELTLVSEGLLQVFDQLAPDDDFMRTKGYRLVLKNCVACHMVKRIGYGQMGPDLDILFKSRSENDFTKQIRNPKGRMIAFGKEQISDDDISAIRSYLAFIIQKHEPRK